MPGEDITSWSKIAANNATADTLIDWREGQARASVNDSERSVMAAHAKDRDLKNGSITTGGTANAQTFTSGVGYTGTVPTGLRATLKVGASLTNTASLTLNMDGIGNITVKNQRGSNLGGGEWLAGSLVDVIYDGTNWILQTEQNISGAILNAGRLQYVSGTEIKFVPFNGDRIKIDGAVYPIPAAGVSIANTNVTVDFTPASNLAANTTYLLCLVGGTLTPFFMTNITAHSPSTTPGNVGTEIYATNDPLSVIGLIYTNASAQFEDSQSNRAVLSWFNRRRRPLIGVPFTNAGISTQYPTFLGTFATFLTWGEAMSASIAGCLVVCDGAGYSVYVNIGIDGISTLIGPTCGTYAADANVAYSVACSGVINTTEGYHSLNFVGGVAPPDTVGTRFYGQAQAEIWG